MLAATAAKQYDGRVRRPKVTGRAVKPNETAKTLFFKERQKELRWVLRARPRRETREKSIK